MSEDPTMRLGKGCDIQASPQAEPSQTGTNPSRSSHSSASVAAQINRRSSMAARRGDAEHPCVWDAHNSALMSAQAVDGTLFPAEAKDDLVIELSVSLKPRPPALGVWALRRAFRSLA